MNTDTLRHHTIGGLQWVAELIARIFEGLWLYWSGLVVLAGYALVGGSVVGLAYGATESLAVAVVVGEVMIVAVPASAHYIYEAFHE